MIPGSACAGYVHLGVMVCFRILEYGRREYLASLYNGVKISLIVNLLLLNGQFETSQRSIPYRASLGSIIYEYESLKNYRIGLTGLSIKGNRQLIYRDHKPKAKRFNALMTVMILSSYFDNQRSVSRKFSARLISLLTREAW